MYRLRHENREKCADADAHADDDDDDADDDIDDLGNGKLIHTVFCQCQRVLKRQT